MRAYLSYSLNDEQQYVVTVLAQVLREKGYELTAGGNRGLRVLPGASRNPWVGCSLFIGVITPYGMEPQRVMDEYNKAIGLSIPALLLVDHSIAYAAGIEPGPGIVLFDEYDPRPAMERVRRNVKQAHVQPQNDESSAWVLGGLAVLTLIALLSSKK